MDWLEIKEFFKDAFKYIVVIIVVLFLAIYIISLQQVVGSSMSPTLKNNDIVLLDKAAYRFGKIKRNDIVALSYADTKFLIKRVVGLPGETVAFQNGNLYINGVLTEEPYLKNVQTEDFNITSLGYEKIPDNMYLVLGDNRGDSMDSRDPEVGLIKKKDIIGKVRVRIWPLNKIKLVK